MDFNQLNIIIGFSANVVGLVIGGGAAFTIARKLYDARTANYKEEIESLDKLAKSRGERIELLEADCADLARSALKRHVKELKDGNDAKGIAALEEWFQSQREDIGSVAKHLAEHYSSYSEPEIVKDSLIRAEHAATLASVCLTNTGEIAELLTENRVAADEKASTGADRSFGRAVDVIEDFALPSPTP